MKPIHFIFGLFLAALVLTLSGGCKSVLWYKYNMRQPSEETPEKLVSFLKENNFPAEDLYMFTDSAAYTRALRNPDFLKNLLSHMLFDRNGGLIERDTTRCQWAGSDLIRALDPDSSYTISPDLKLDQILKDIKPFGPARPADTLLREPDFTLVVTWAKFIGKYNYRLFDLSDAVRANKKAVIRIVWLNCDMQEEWHLPVNQKIGIR